MLDEDDDYFAKETPVFNEFIRQAQAAIDDENVNDIYIDATHLSQGSRNKTMKRLNLDNVGMTICVSFDVPIGICKARNALREGRAKVPDKVIENMRTSFTIPVCGFNEIWVINEEGMRVDDLANF